MDENGKAVCKCKGKYTGPTCKGNLPLLSQSLKVFTNGFGNMPMIPNVTLSLRHVWPEQLVGQSLIL